ncbi:branched-chain amino acid ABC transporter permease [Thermogemmatispora carboxidivorans]|uniref:branched-chain amino acid ABC transporter permease n=1 Tax=Thermogemmatispora carboxidivorans TaxID=1382306 RepID=UPI000699A0D6|nr:branched-chain amino acid ABC transporter permease [Thermogemmatispora carboxidivorans]
MLIVQVIVNWLLLGSLYAAVALGFSLVWGIMNIVNLAHGAFILVGAYAAYWAFTQLHIDPFLGLPLTMLLLFCLGWIVQYVAINRVIRAPFLMTFLLTFGLDLLIADVVQLLFTSDRRSINTAYSGFGLTLGTLHIPFDRLLAALIAVLLTAALSLFLQRTRTGNAILATGMDRDAARLMGIRIDRIYALTFGLGAALAGAAGAMLVELYPFDPSQGGVFTLRAFVIVVLGGLGTPWGALAGGLVFGLAETVVPLLPGIGPGYDDAIAFALMVLVLIIRPRGILGKAFYA